MSKYMEPVLKIIIVLTIGMIILRIRYIWSILKKESQYIFRNREGDFMVLIFLLLIIMNQSRFKGYKLSYQPFLRHFYAIVIGLFIAYCLHQLTQVVVLTKTTLISPQGMIENKDIIKYETKKRIYGYKVTIYYMKKDKKAHQILMMGKKDKEEMEQIGRRHNVNIM